MKKECNRESNGMERSPDDRQWKYGWIEKRGEPHWQVDEDVGDRIQYVVFLPQN